MIIVYGVLALLGLVVPWIFNVQFMQAHGGFSTSTFIAEAFSVPAARSISVDLTIACTAWIVWMVREARALKMRHWWVYIVLVFAVAFAFACPLFLLMRERRLRTAEAGARA
jgi:hypothetical protein